MHWNTIHFAVLYRYGGPTAGRPLWEEKLFKCDVRAPILIWRNLVVYNVVVVSNPRTICDTFVGTTQNGSK
jgi:hypothetical protein